MELHTLHTELNTEIDPTLPRMEMLKKSLELKLQAETNRASEWVCYLKYSCEKNHPRLLKRWTEYRNDMLRRMMLVKKMEMDDFRLALHKNQYGIQQAIFGQN